MNAGFVITCAVIAMLMFAVGVITYAVPGTLPFAIGGTLAGFAIVNVFKQWGDRG